MMDQLEKQMEVSLARKAAADAGLFLSSQEQIGQLAGVAEDAYQDYPLHNWLTGGKYDPVVSKKIMEISLKTMKQDGVIYADSEALNGFTVWLPPGFAGSKTLPFLLHGGLGLIARCGPGIIGRLLNYESYAMELKEKYTGHADWYLYNLSISKQAQGKGVATKLMQPMLDFCDRKQMVCYLETNKQDNVAIYEHFGFRLMEQGRIPKSNVKHYAMVRQPVQI